MILGDIQLSQHCCARERTITDAAAGIGDVVAYADQTLRGISILSLDFPTAFDEVSHDYFYNILSENGFDNIRLESRVCYKRMLPPVMT